MVEKQGYEVEVVSKIKVTEKSKGLAEAQARSSTEALDNDPHLEDAEVESVEAEEMEDG